MILMSLISEKSLEMNVNENLVNVIRQWGGLFSKAFIYGFTLREEKYRGLDSSINLPGNNRFLFALQYKKPTNMNNNIYRFEINTNRKQHVILRISSFLYKNVWYVFPLFIDTLELSQCSPNFLDRTCFINICDFPPYTFNSDIHVVEINSQNFSASVFSRNKMPIETYSGKEFLRKMREEIKPTTVKEIKSERLSWDKIYTELSKLGIKVTVLDEIREERGELRYRFTSGFFAL